MREVEARGERQSDFSESARLYSPWVTCQIGLEWLRSVSLEAAGLTEKPTFALTEAPLHGYDNHNLGFEIQNVTVICQLQEWPLH